MQLQPEHLGEAVARLQRCINDLESLLALPALSSDDQPAQFVRTLVDALLNSLSLDLVYVRLKSAGGAEPLEILRSVRSQESTALAGQIGQVFRPWLADDSPKLPRLVRNPLADGNITIVTLRLGLHGELGEMVAGAQRADFPRACENVLLNVAANQAALALQNAQLQREQKRGFSEVDQNAAQRTPPPAAAKRESKQEQLAAVTEETAQRENRELKRSEARTAAILDSALDCIVTMDHEGRITEFNPAAERTFGYRRQEVLGKPMADVIIPPSLREQHRRGLAHYLATGEARVLGKHLQLTAMRADGSEFPVELAITLLPLDGPPSFTGQVRDITERKRSEEELRRSEAFLAQALRISSTGSFSWRVSTDEITWSQHLYSIFALDRDARVTLELIRTRVHPDDMSLVNDMLDRARREGGDFDLEYRLQLPACAVKHVRMIAHGIQDEAPPLEYIGAIQDVTESRRAEEALVNVRSELARVTRVTSMGVLAASIAHEVTQPLAGILTNANTCLRMLANDPPNIDGARETVHRTIRAGNRACDVVTRLRSFFIKRNSAPESVDLNEATREIIALSLSQLQRSRIIVRPDLADGLPPVTGDRVQLQQVILNLLLNAVDAMSGIEDHPRNLLIRTERTEHDQVVLTMQDAGVGIATQDVERLFEPFYTTKSGGMGIGLSVSRSIIETHHGRLWAVSNEGPGATFSFSIPSHVSA
jgi:PAS domain S-box-containing protein